MANDRETPSATSLAHTSGPWRIAGESCNDGEAFIIEADTRTVCWTANTIGADDSETISDEDRANAVLIASAPSQNDALNKMVDSIFEMLDDEDLQITSDCGDLLLQIAQIGNAAIREATGKAA